MKQSFYNLYINEALKIFKESFIRNLIVEGGYLCYSVETMEKERFMEASIYF